MRRLVIGMVILTLWGIFLSCCVYLYAHFGTEAQRAEYVTRKIEESLDIPMNLADIVVGITPYPHALLRDISLHGAWGSFDAKEIKLEMSWASLGKYEFMPGKITVTGPSVKLDIDKLLEQAASAGDVRMESAPPVFPYMDRIDLPGVLADLSIDIQDGYFDLTRKEEKVLLSGVDGQIKLPGLFAGSADFKMKDVKIFRADQYVFNVGDLYLNAARIRLPGDRQILRGTFSLTGKCAAAGIFDSLDTSLVIRAGGGSGRTGGGSGRAGDSSRRTGDSSNRAGGSFRRGGGSSREPALFATIALSGLVVDGEAIDGRMNLPLLFEAPDRKRTVGRIENAILEMDKDRIRLDGVLDFSDTPTLDGILGIERFSLTRWFGFTRAFPPGLQVLLSDLSGEMDFSVNEHGLKVPRLEAVVKQRPYAGTASVEDFSKPDLRIALKTEYADLDHVLPELTQEGFSAPHWPRALVEAGGEGKGIDFDISIDADGGKFMFADCGKLNFRVVSANKEDYAVFAAEKIYGGSINARADFMGESMKLQAGISRMNAEPLSRAVLPQNPVGGQIDAVAGISFRTGGFSSFAASLAGALDCTVQDGYFTVKSGRQDFSKLEFSFKGAGTGAHEDTLLPENFVYTGDWKLSLQAADWRAGINAKGPVRFNTNFMPVLISDLPGRVQGNHMGVDLDATASFSYDAGRDRLDVKKIQGTISGGKVSGSFGGAPLGGNTVWQGQLDVGSTTLRATLKGLNLLPEDLPPSAFRSMKANSQFTISDAQWRLEKLSGRIDQTTLSGSIIRNAATVPLWNVDLALGDIDSARYLSSKSKEGPAKPWPTQLLREQNISGQISIASVLFKGLKFERLRLPVELKNGVLKSDPFRGAFAEGRINGAFSTQAHEDGASSNLAVSVARLNMGTITKGIDAGAIIEGTADGGMYLDALANSFDDILKKLSGSWNFQIKNGSLRQKGDKSPPTAFSNMGASGTVNSGIIRSKDLRVDGSDLAVSGNGEINLPKWTIDYKLNVSLGGLKNIPVAFSGKLDDPNRSINPFGVIASVLGGLGENVINLITAPFKLLTPQRK